MINNLPPGLKLVDTQVNTGVSLPPGLSLVTSSTSEVKPELISQFPDQQVEKPQVTGQQETPSILQSVEDEEPVDFERLEWSDIINEAVANLPTSAVKTVKDLLGTVEHPWETIKNLGNLVAGVVNKLTPGHQASEDYADLLISFYKDRYGSIKGFKKAIATDPVGVLLDGASILIPGGSAIKGLGTATKIKALVNLGKRLSKIGATLDPLAAGVQGLGKVAGVVIPKSFPVNLYQRATRLGEYMPKNLRKDIVKFALDKKIMPTLKGIDRIQDKINLINAEISDLIDRATLTGVEIPVKQLKRGLKQLQKEAAVTAFGKTKQAKQIINRIQRDIWETHIKHGSGKLTPKEVQRIKQNIYRDLSKYYEGVIKTPIEAKAYKIIARNAKEEIEKIFPELENLKYVKELKKASKVSIKDLNALESSYLKVLEGLDHPVPFSWGDPVTKYQQYRRTMYGYTTPIPEAIGMSLMHGLFNSKRIRAKMAILANQLQKQGIKLSPAWVEFGIIGRTPERIRGEE